MPDSNEAAESMRLHRRIALAGVSSRRAAEELIRAGRVAVNGEVVTEMGTKVGPEDKVSVDGEPLPAQRSITLIMNKPLGVVTTLSDPKRRPTVVRHLPKLPTVVKPVGRLDMDTEGALILTSDGDLAHRLAHPRYQIDKEYEAVVRGAPSEEALGRLRTGVSLEDGKTNPAKVDLVGKPRDGADGVTSMLRLVIHEGKNRQVRRMCEAVGHPVVALKRVRIAFIGVRNLRSGECRILGVAEVERLRKMVGL